MLAGPLQADGYFYAYCKHKNQSSQNGNDSCKELSKAH